MTTRAQISALYAFFFLMGAETYIVNPLIPTIARALRVSPQLATISLSAFVLAYAVTGPVFAPLSVGSRRKRLIVWGTVLFSVGNIVCAVGPDILFLGAGRALAGVGAGMTAPSAWAYISSVTDPKSRGKLVSYGVAVYGAGQVLGVPLGALIASLTSWRHALFGVGVLFSLLVPVLQRTLGIVVERSGATDGDNAPRRGLWREALFLLPIAGTFFFQAARLGLYSYVSSILDHRFAISVTEQGFVGLATGLSAIAGTLGAGFLCGWLRNGGTTVLYGSLLFAAIFAVFAVASLYSIRLEWFFGLLLLWCVAGGGFYSVQQIYFSNFPQHVRALAIAMNSTVMNLGIAVGTAILGSFELGGAAFTATVAGFTAVSFVLVSVAVHQASKR